MSLALLIIAVIDHGHLQTDYSGASPHSSGLMRLGRDLRRRTGGETNLKEAGPDSISSRGNSASTMTSYGDILVVLESGEVSLGRPAEKHCTRAS
jgi:hypothetical protein